MREIIDFLVSPTVVGGYVAAVVGGLIMHLWTRYLRRMITVRWSVRIHNIATSTDGDQTGNIQVLYEGHAVPNLYMIELELENMSTSRDMADFDFMLRLDDGSRHLRGHGVIGPSGRYLGWTPAFAAMFDQHVEATKRGEQEPQVALAMATRRDFRIPAFNRGQSARFEFLVTTNAGSAPFLNLHTDVPGVRLQRKSERATVFGVFQRDALVLGHVVGLTAAIIIGVQSTGSAWAVIGGFLLGDLVVGIGAALIHAKRLVVRAIG